LGFSEIDPEFSSSSQKTVTLIGSQRKTCWVVFKGDERRYTSSWVILPSGASRLLRPFSAGGTLYTSRALLRTHRRLYPFASFPRTRKPARGAEY